MRNTRYYIVMGNGNCEFKELPHAMIAVVAEVECTDNQSRGSPKGSADSGSTAGLLYFVCHGAVSGARPVPMVRVAFQLVHRLFGDASARAVS